MDPKIPGPRGSQTDLPVSYVRVSTARELPQTMDVKNQYQNPTAYDGVKSIDIYQRQTSSIDYQTQANGSSSQDQSNGISYQKKTSSSEIQTQANGSSGRDQSSGIRYENQTNVSDNEPKSIPSHTQAATNEGQIAQAASLSDPEFFEILKLGIKLSDPVLSDILHVYSPIVLGPVGSPLGALAGAILASAGKIAATHSAPVHDFRQGLPYDGVLERAILGEAAFTVVMSMKRRKLEEMGIFADMAEIVNKMAPITKQLAPYVMHILTAPALRVALHALSDDPRRSKSRPEVTVSGHENPFVKPYTPSTTSLEPEIDTFLKRLLAHCIGHDESKDSFDNINRIIQVGFREAGPVLTTIAHEGLEFLTSTLPDSGVQGPGIPSRRPYIVGLPERAMLGEAALQALIKVSKHQLDERTFDIMAQTIDNIGGIVLSLAPGLIEDVGFSVKALVVVPSIGAEGIADDKVSSDTVAGGVASDTVAGGVASDTVAGGVASDTVAGGVASDTVADGVSSDIVAGGTSQTATDRRVKGHSFVNLEQEFLNYYRENNLKPMPSIDED